MTFNELNTRIKNADSVEFFHHVGARKDNQSGAHMWIKTGSKYEAVFVGRDLTTGEDIIELLYGG